MIKKLYFWALAPMHRRVLAESESKIFNRLESSHLETFEKRYSDWLDKRVKEEVEKRLETVMNEEVERRMAVVIKQNLQFQEKFTAKFVDEIVGVYLEMEKLSAFIGIDEKPADDKFSDEVIWTLLKRITREAKIPELAREYNVPIRDVLVWRSKYDRMDAVTIGQIRKLEKENLRLRKGMEELAPLSS